ncbi:MAG: hypothetical protein P1U87_11900 [Verrucomicrobiales bacterium]|nr:hypothetical protein [Verrucomicrobiales bacterium]
MQLSYVPTEDRILFRLNTKARQEFRFWMTRRYMEILWNTLAKIIAESDSKKEVDITKSERQPVMKDALVESAKKEIEHKEKIATSDFETQYQESSYLPLGEEPALLFSVGIKPNPQGQPMLCMHPEKGQGIEMVLNDQILHSLCKLIVDTSAKAKWNQDLRFTPPASSEDDPPAGLN